MGFEGISVQTTHPNELAIGEKFRSSLGTAEVSQF
jgi:hypothetical protein